MVIGTTNGGFGNSTDEFGQPTPCQPTEVDLMPNDMNDSASHPSRELRAKIGSTARRAIEEAAPPGHATTRYLCHLIRRLAEDRGFDEAPSEFSRRQNAAVILRKGALLIAFLVVPDATVELELDPTGYTHVFLIPTGQRQRKQLARRIKTTSLAVSVDVLTPEDVSTTLDRLGAGPTMPDGRRVTVIHRRLSDEEVLRRREAIAAVIARSLARLGRS